MRFLIFDHYITAKQSLTRARLRTLLTLTGVAIGIASITAILSLSQGVNRVITKQINSLGGNVAVVRPVANKATLVDLSNPTPQNAYSTSPLSERDLEVIGNVPRTAAVAPLMTISGSIRTKSNTPKISTLLATTPALADINNLAIRDGQFIDSVTRQNTAVVGSQLSVDLFGTDQAIGKNFLIRGQTFTVIGVLKPQNDPVNYNNVDFDHTAIISFDSGKLFNSGVAQIQQINVKTAPGTDMKAYAKKVNHELIKNHDRQQDVAVFVGKEIAEPTSQLFQLISALISVVAGISLLVGGIGIMNIMLVGVSERTREIGLRKAVGASNTTIIVQFMIEALIISVLGGILGFTGGYVLAFFVSMFIPYDPAFSWSIVGWTAVLSIGVGVVFGLYPAIRAARKDPIESLRRYH